MQSKDYSVYVEFISQYPVYDFIGYHTIFKIKAIVRQASHTYEAYGTGLTLEKAEDLAKKRALKLIGVRYYIKS